MKLVRALPWFCAALWAGQVFAAASDKMAIDSISVEGTNLVFTVTLPPGVDQAVLEMRPAFSDPWQSLAELKVPTDGGTMEFTLSKPALETAFFRLNATLRTASDTQYSSELQFVAVPPLGPDSANTNEAVFHFKGVIDGSDRILITRQGALWEHVNWGWPEGAVTVNDTKWKPSEKNFMTTTGAVLYLPQRYSLDSPRLEVIEGRDVAALERTNAALIVYLDDTPVGAAPYEFKIHFPLAAPEIERAKPSPVATLKIGTVIDGSDILKITGEAATWTHRVWDCPAAVKLNDVIWNVRQTNVLSNAETNRYLPAGIDFSTARITKRQGRDVVTMWADNDALLVNFADNPNGADAYELEISFGFGEAAEAKTGDAAPTE